MGTRHVIAIVLALLWAASSATADLVIDWNTQWLQAVKATGGGPGPIARTGAMLHVAIHDALQATDRTATSYLYTGSAPGASAEAAVNSAAHHVLSNLFPSFSSEFDSAYQQHQSQITDGPAKLAGTSIGVAAGEAILQARASDGWDNDTPYTSSIGPGHWVPTEPGEAGQAWGPNWHEVSPWVINSHDQFRPPAPPALTSDAYATAFEQVKQLGSIDSTARTDEQTRIALFWANDRDGTWKPPGHLNHATQVVANDAGLSLSENARLFALTNLAMADASIVAWDSKFATDLDFWRPVTGIHQADEDGNPVTLADPDWEPLSAHPGVNGFTPAFPAYVSGHGTFAAAWAAIMAAYFRTDDVTFTLESGDPAYDALVLEGAPATRTYQSFSEAALENGLSRVYLGVHWLFDSEMAYPLGQATGRYVYEHALTLIPEPSMAVLLLGSGAAVIAWHPRRRGR